MSYYISDLTLESFRNFKNKKFTFSNKPIFLIGDNGIGKTSIIEALSLLAPGKGLRNALLEDMNNKSIKQNFSIHSTLYNDFFGNINLSTNAIHNKSSLSRSIYVDNKELKKQTTVGLYLNVVWLTPKMDLFFLESKEHKRKFIDRLIFTINPEHATYINNYDKLIKQRKNLLYKNINDTLMLDAIEQTIIEYGINISINRIDFIDRLNKVMLQKKLPLALPKVEFKGTIESIINNSPTTIKAEEEYANQLNNTRKQDIKSNRTSIGTHTSELVIHHINNNQLAQHCSTGEQKLLLINILFGYIYIYMLEKNAIPLLLLDELLSHLDPEKQIFVIDELLKLEQQFFITANTFNLPKKYYDIFEIIDLNTI